MLNNDTSGPQTGSHKRAIIRHEPDAAVQEIGEQAPGAAIQDVLLSIKPQRTDRGLPPGILMQTMSPCL